MPRLRQSSTSERLLLGTFALAVLAGYNLGRATDLTRPLAVFCIGAVIVLHLLVLAFRRGRP